MGLDVYSRREYKQGKFVYLLDDEEKTAWIGKGHIGRCRRYRLPDHVLVDGQRYTVESVELGAYNHPRTLRRLVIPNTFVFVDCDTLYGLENLRSVYIGKRVEQLNSFNFRLCPKLKSIRIDKDNPHLKYENGMVLSKDGKTLWSAYTKRQHTIISNGVEVIGCSAFMDNQQLEHITFPKTLRKIESNGFCNCPKLHSVVLPKYVETVGDQCFMENENLNYVDLPGTLADLGCQTFADCPNVGTVILRSPKKLDFKKCFGAYLHDEPMVAPHLYVPADLVEQYRQDSEWGVFPHILPIQKNPLIIEADEAMHKELMRIMREVAENEITD